MLRSKNRLPICKKSKTGSAKPSLDTLRISTKGSKSALLMVDSKDTDPGRDKPNKEHEKPKREKLRIGDGEPKCRRSKTGMAGSQHARLCKNMARPKCRKSKTDEEKSNLLCPTTNSTESVCAKPQEPAAKWRQEDVVRMQEV